MTSNNYRTALAIVGGAFAIGALAGAAARVIENSTRMLGGLNPRLERSGSASRTTGRALIGGPFSLIDTSGTVTTERTYRGRPTLIYFGYTRSPDLTPAMLQVVSEAMEIIAAAGDITARSPVPLFVTLDPEHDTGPVLAAYLSRFSSRLIGLTGTSAAIDATAAVFRVAFVRTNDTQLPGTVKVAGSAQPKNSQIDYQSLLYVFDTNGSFVTFYRHGVTPRDLANDIMMQMR